MFVSVRGARPRRKVAISIPDKMTWDAFVQQVRGVLRLSCTAARGGGHCGLPTSPSLRADQGQTAGRCRGCDQPRFYRSARDEPGDPGGH